jgi:hypothetical protein
MKQHVTVFALSALLSSAALVMGCGGSDDPCALAAEHVKACTGLEGQAPATCNPDGPASC